MPCASTAFAAETAPLPGASTAFVAKTAPFLADFQTCQSQLAVLHTEIELYRLQQPAVQMAAAVSAADAALRPPPLPTPPPTPPPPPPAGIFDSIGAAASAAAEAIEAEAIALEKRAENGAKGTAFRLCFHRHPLLKTVPFLRQFKTCL